MSRRLTRRLAVVTLFGIVALGADSVPARERSGAQGPPHPSAPKTRAGDPDPQVTEPGAFSTGAEPRLNMPLTFSFTNIARAAGLDGTTVYGGAASNKYLLETTGTGVAAIDYDRDGRLDLFLVNVGRYTTDTIAGDEYKYYVAFEDAFSGHLKPERAERSIL